MLPSSVGELKLNSIYLDLLVRPNLHVQPLAVRAWQQLRILESIWPLFRELMQSISILLACTLKCLHCFFELRVIRR